MNKYKYKNIIFMNIKYIAKNAAALTAIVFAIIGYVGTFVSLDSIINVNLNIGIRICISTAIMAVIWIVLFIIFALYLVKKKRYEIIDIGNNHHIYVQYGDVFSPEIVLNSGQRRNVVIPVNRCFDTTIDDNLISSNTLHGVSMKKMYEEGIYTEQSLNHNIQSYLQSKHYVTDIIGREQKAVGNSTRYPAGAVAEIKADDKLTYFFLGLCRINKNLHAETSNEEYVLAIMRLLEFCNERSQGFPVVIPLIGAGQADTRKTEKDILEYLVKLTKMNRDLLNCDFHIVVHESAKDKISIAEIS